MEPHLKELRLYVRMLDVLTQGLFAFSPNCHPIEVRLEADCQRKRLFCRGVVFTIVSQHSLQVEQPLCDTLIEGSCRQTRAPAAFVRCFSHFELVIGQCISSLAGELSSLALVIAAPSQSSIFVWTGRFSAPREAPAGYDRSDQSIDRRRMLLELGSSCCPKNSNFVIQA